jgi:two-component system OmpR family response regulator
MSKQDQPPLPPDMAIRGRAADDKRASILLVEDDVAIADDTKGELEAFGYAVTWCATAEDALIAAESDGFDLLLVDRMLPKMDGLTLVGHLRARSPRLPVIILSALDAVEERVTGLEAGGDDYLIKPFALSELAARIQAQLRRPTETRDTVLRQGPLEADLIERTVTNAGQPVDLLPREFQLLVYFMRRPGQLVTRGMLLEDVWNYRFLPETNLVDVHLGKLRRKIDIPGATSLIQNVRGAGFIFRAPQ